jgi:hypothetical protein
MKGVLEIRKESYVINKEKKTVTYIINVCTVNAGIIGGNNNIFCSEYSLMKYLGMKNYKKDIVGVAKCNPDDEFDEKKGIQIARNRAEIKVAQLEQKAIGWIFKHLTIVSHYLIELSSNRERMINEKKNFIKNI